MYRISTNHTLFLVWFTTASLSVSAFLFLSGAYNQSLENVYDLFLLALNCP
jgi:hypothetical protein